MKKAGLQIHSTVGPDKVLSAINVNPKDGWIQDTAYSGAHATAQLTGLRLETMSQALFQGLF